MPAVRLSGGQLRLVRTLAGSAAHAGARALLEAIGRHNLAAWSGADQPETEWTQGEAGVHTVQASHLEVAVDHVGEAAGEVAIGVVVDHTMDRRDQRLEASRQHMVQPLSAVWPRELVAKHTEQRDTMADVSSAHMGRSGEA